MKKIAYITGCFGSLSHTFIRREVKEAESMGFSISLFAIRRDVARELSADDEFLVARTFYLYPLNFFKILLSHGFFFLSKPKAYFKTFSRAIFNEELNPLQHLKLIYHFLISAHKARLMAKHEVAHIHAHFMNIPTTIAMYCAGLLEIPFSFTNHTGSPRPLKEMIGLREKIKSAQFLCTISEDSLKRLEIIYPCREKSHIVHCGVDLEHHRFSMKHASRCDPEKLRLLNIGRMVEFKGQKYAIQALEILKKNKILAELTFIGNGSLLDDLRSLAELRGLTRDVFFAGALSESQVVSYMGNYDLLIVSSIETRMGKMEGLPVVIMEALAAGLPVVASRSAGIPEIIEDQKTGLLSVPGDPESIAMAVLRMANDSALRERCIYEGRKKVENDFDIKKITKQKIKIFERFLI